MPQVGTNGNDPETFFNNTDPVIYGLDGDDFIRFTGEPSSVFGGAYIEGGRGNDTIYSGPGRDTVYGGDGDDFINGGGVPGFRGGESSIGDRLYGGAGNDIIHSGGAGNDRIFGDEGNDTIYGGDGTSYLDGGPGNDIIFAGNASSRATVVFGGDGDDILYGMTGAGVLYGGNGSDIYEVTSLNTKVFETEAVGYDKDFGRDIVFAYVDFALPDHVEHLVMTYGVQTYGYGNSGDNIIIGNASNNVLEGKGGYDTLTGGAGTDLFVVNPNWGVDVITDFTAGAGTQDAVMFSRAIFSNYQQVIGNARQVGSDTWIGDGAGNTVVLQNVLLTSLHPDDFGFI
ncbi:MAG: hypothetical protein M3438_10585 [Pseudomonadota bacterium]|nr:hypothetical protein [Pseudomonadota bacterium]